MAAPREPAPAVGRPAPPLRLTDRHGHTVDLREFLGRAPVVLFFYPRAGTAGCTKEACAFRDEYEPLRDLGAEVIGVSADHVEALTRFASEHRLPFALLSDPDGVARRAWGVRNDFWLLPGRVTFVIDQDGVVRHTFRSALNMRRHVEEATMALRRLAARPSPSPSPPA